MTNRAQRQVGFGDLGHRDRRLDASGHAGLVDEVLQGEGIHDGTEHPHVVRARTLQPLEGKLSTTEEVTAADNDCNLDALTYGRGHLLSDVANDLGIQADRSTSECLSGKLEQNAALRRHDASPL